MKLLYTPQIVFIIFQQLLQNMTTLNINLNIIICRRNKTSSLILIISITLYLLLNVFSLNLTAQQLVIAADVWCPVNCSIKDEKPGYMIEVARQIFNQNNIQVEYKQYLGQELSLKLIKAI
jgi:hypothetical protein